MTDEELIEELSEMGGHPCRAHLPMGERLRQASDRLKALREALQDLLTVYVRDGERIDALTAAIKQLRERLAALDQQAETLGGCGDANCVIHCPKGQHTNGGCHCYEDSAKMRIWTQQVSYFRSKVQAALKKQP